MWPERLLSRLDGDRPGTRRVKLRAFQVILAAVICTEYWTKALRRWGELDLEDAIGLVAVVVFTAAVAHGRWRRVGFAGFALLQTWYVWSLFPLVGNHRYLEAVLAGLFALLDDDSKEERLLLLRSLRWIVVVVLFWSGLQKLAHGYYLHGQFLAWSLWREPFRLVLEPLLSGAEVERLADYAGVVGDGPYLVSSPLFVALSNLVWVAEIGLAVLLVPRATRRFACVATCLFIIATEGVARELMFGVEFLCAVLLFLESGFLRRMLIPALLFLALLVLLRLGVIPEVPFH